MANTQEENQRLQREEILRREREDKLNEQMEEEENSQQQPTATKKEQFSEKEKTAYDKANSYHSISTLSYADNPGLFLIAILFKYDLYKADKQKYEKKLEALNAAKRKLNESPGQDGIEAGKEEKNQIEKDQSDPYTYFSIPEEKDQEKRDIDTVKQALKESLQEAGVDPQQVNITEEISEEDCCLKIDQPLTGELRDTVFHHFSTKLGCTVPQPQRNHNKDEEESQAPSLKMSKE